MSKRESKQLNTQSCLGTGVAPKANHPVLTCGTCGRDRASLKAYAEYECVTRLELVYWLLRAYQSGHREGWEPGPSTDETMDRICDVLANAGYDPSGEKARELLTQPFGVHVKGTTYKR